jgi:glycosyltransferase involved in cell wall biosynthesis
LTVGTLTAKKGHAHLLEALAEVQNGREVTLDLVGAGELRAELEERIRQLGLTDVVRFHGERPKEEVAELMREADLFVLPSLFENLPCVLIEAMASGLPFVATDVGGIPELLDGAGGFLCPPGDARALAETILRALDRLTEIDPHLLADRARRRFGYGPFEGTWTQIYGELRSSAGMTS